ncbi:transketolase [Crossiella sp. NPDC003009]
MTELAGREVTRTALRRLANQLRADAIRTSTAAGSGHPTSAMSCADVVATLMSRHFRYDWADPAHPDNDRLVLSKGHVSGLWYSVLAAAGAIEVEELSTYRQRGSRLQGHPTPDLQWVDVATGSLGQGLPIGVGMALAARLARRPYRVWVLCGDGELAEGSMWEAFDKAAIHGLANLTAIIDVNGYGQSGPVPHRSPAETYAARLRAFGWQVAEVDGHDLDQVDAALAQAGANAEPLAIVARTVKGQGFDEITHRAEMHGAALDEATARRALALIEPPERVRLTGPPPPREPAQPPPARTEVRLPRYAVGDLVAIRDAFGDALAELGERPEVVVIDGDVTVSMRTDRFAARHPGRFIETYIAEQQMLGTAIGLSARGFTPVVSTYGAFLSRAYDFVRMAAISRSRLVLAGSHGGVEIGRDGPSQMALEDLAAMRAIHGSVVLYPSEAVSAGALTKAALDTGGICYLRITRNARPVLYGSDEQFPVGGSKTPRSDERDSVVLAAAGVTVHEALEAADTLDAQGIHARVLDLYSVKPCDTAAVRRALAATGGQLVVAEDHRPEGGLGAAIFEGLAEQEITYRARHLAVRTMPGSASPAEQLDLAGISAGHIAAAARDLLRGGDLDR